MNAARMQTQRSKTPARRAALLLEVMLSLSLFVSAGAAILSIVGQSTASLRATRHRQKAVDLARSAMAEIEAGVRTVEVLNGPVAAWRDEDQDGASGDTRDSGWELRVQTDPSEFDGLTLVTVTAARVGADEYSSGSFTLRQLVRLFPAGEEGVGDVDDLTREAERGEPRGGGERRAPEDRRPGSRAPGRERGTP